MSFIDEELYHKIGDEIWGKVRARKWLGIHILMVLYCTMHYKNSLESPLEEIRSEQELNTLLWASLFHDIDKVTLYDNPDWSHPFLSAALSLWIFKSFGIISAEIDEACDLIKSSCVKISSKSYWKKMKKDEVKNPAPNEHDHSKLDKIFEALWKIYEWDSFVDDVIKHVMFHQSFWGIKKYKPRVVISDEDALKYFSKDWFRQNKVIQYADSYAHCFFHGIKQMK